MNKQEIYITAVEPVLYNHLILRCNRHGDIVSGHKDINGLYNVCMKADEIVVLTSHDMGERVAIYFKLDKEEDVVQCKKQDFWTISLF